MSVNMSVLCFCSLSNSLKVSSTFCKALDSVGYCKRWFLLHLHAFLSIILRTIIIIIRPIIIKSVVKYAQIKLVLSRSIL